MLVGVRVAGGDLSMLLALRSTDRAGRRDYPKPLYETEAFYGKPKAEHTDEILGHGGRKTPH